MKESVWDYPRPPRLESVTDTLEVRFGGEVVAKTTAGYRVLETSHPPTYYIPESDVRREFLRPAKGPKSVCEFKGQASYVDLVVGTAVSERAAWFYSAPWAPFEALANHYCFYASRVDAAFVRGEQVKAQEGDFYGGWITSWIEGPFKGPPGTLGW